MRKALLCLTVILLLSNGAVWGSEKEKLKEDIRVDKSFGIGVQALGPTVIASGYIDLFLSPYMNLEVGFGMLGFYGGAKYYFSRTDEERRWFPFTGVMIAFIPAILDADESISVYVPLGIQYMFPSGLMFGVEAAVMAGERGILPHGALRTAFRF